MQPAPPRAHPLPAYRYITLPSLSQLQSQTVTSTSPRLALAASLLGPLIPIQPLRPTESHYSYNTPTSNFPFHHSHEVLFDFNQPTLFITTTMAPSSNQQQLADPSVDTMDHDLDQDAQEATTSLPNIIPDSQLSPDTYRFPSERLLRRQRHEGKAPLVLVACGSFRFVIPSSSIALLPLPSAMTQSEQPH